MYRVEDKYALPSSDFYLLRNRISSILPSDSNDLENRGYKISSIYFDDIYDTHYKDTIAGNPTRDKYRIRIYNDSFETIKLEVKSKQYSRIFKRGIKITYEEMEALISGESIKGSEDLDDPRTAFNVAIKTRYLRPKVIVTYERKAFIYDSGNVRITFDTNIRGSDRIDLFGSKDLIYEYPMEETSVLEVKYDEFLPDFIAQSLEINSMWQIANSKYRICRDIYNLH